jgi:AcrR family transcriptional regulator
MNTSSAKSIKENPKGPGRPRSEAAEKAILEATLQLLAELGYGGLTMDKVAAEAKVSKATMYRRWPSKVHLVITAFSQLPQLPCPDTGHLKKDLIEVLQSFLLIAQNASLAGVLPTLAGERARSPELADYLDEATRQRREPVKKVLLRAIKRKELPANTDIELAIDLVMSPLVMRIFFTNNPADMNFLEQVIDHTLKGLS